MLGCDKCLDPCPVNCIHPDPDWEPAPDEWWSEPLTAELTRAIYDVRPMAKRLTRDEVAHVALLARLS